MQKKKIKNNITLRLRVMSVLSFCVVSVWMWMCVFVYLQSREAAIRGFLPKNTDVEKTERAQEGLWLDAPAHGQNKDVGLSLSRFIIFFFLIRGLLFSWRRRWTSRPMCCE